MVSSQQSKQPRSLLQWVLVLILLLLSTQVTAAAPQPQAAAGAPGVVSYQGQVTVSGQPYDGTGYFKFAVVDAAGTKTYWSNDGTAEGEKEPDKGVKLIVRRGLFTVLLGDIKLDGMTQPLSAEIFSGGATSGGRYLRVWFSADDSIYTQLSLDQRIAAVPYALVAQEAVSSSNADQLDGQHAAAFAMSTHLHDNDDIPKGALNPDRISGTAWTGSNDGSGSGLDADTLDGLETTDLLVPRGTIVLGVPGTTHLEDAGYQLLGLSNVTCITCEGFKGSWSDVPLIKGTPPPAARIDHTAVWTGTEMIVWGGQNGSGSPMNTGGRYNPTTNTWTLLPTTDNTNQPLTGRYLHTAVWTGTEMIVWGGLGDDADHNGSPDPLNTGYRYKPATNTWTPLPLYGLARRYHHTAVWTGTEMIVWGGLGDTFNVTTGYIFNPAYDTSFAWSELPLKNVNGDNIVGRFAHTAVWTGTEMIVWGGQGGGRDDAGGRFNPATNTWTPLPYYNGPHVRDNHTAVWTGSEMIVWGGQDDIDNDGTPDSLNSGYRYNPVTDTWTPLPATTSTGVTLASRYNHTAVWTGTEMIVWGGRMTGPRNAGRYNPVTNTWISLPDTGDPLERYDHTAVWTGLEMIVWGGTDSIGSPTTVERYTLLLSLFQKP